MRRVLKTLLPCLAILFGIVVPSPAGARTECGTPALNAVNGLQDSAIGTANLATWISPTYIAYRTLGGAPFSIGSPGWARGVMMDETDFEHNFSKLAGSIGIEMIFGLKGAGLVRWAPNNTAPAFRTWNQFQSGTAGQFATRAEAGAAWSVYKGANGIVTGATRSTAARSEFLRGMAESGKSPSWMNQWLQQGKVPPDYHVDHIRPLSIGGADTPSNMRLLDIDMHRMHHRYYRPWE